MGGRFTNKPAPTINDAAVGFVTGDAGPVGGWTTHTVNFSGTQTTFTRTVEDGVATVTVDCDDPDMLLLARKGDEAYWSSRWYDQLDDCRLWSADIVCRMFEEGLVATVNDDGVGVLTAMLAAAGRPTPGWTTSPHVLTGTVAQLRGLALVQSMAPDTGWDTKIGGYSIPRHLGGLLRDRFNDVCDVYEVLEHPPWDDDVEWGSRNVAGYATTSDGDDVFVGVNSDLLWRALTETDDGGFSLLKARYANPDVAGLLPDMVEKEFSSATGMASAEMTVAAALHDETAVEQLTTGLFDGVHPNYRRNLQTNLLSVFDQQLRPYTGESRWTIEQQTRIRGFVDLVGGLKP